MSEFSGQILGKYTLHEEMLSSGTTRIYRAEQTPSGRNVMVKFVPGEYAAGDPSLSERLQNEVRVNNLVQHPNIVSVFDYDEQDGTPYVVLPFYQSGTLFDAMEQPDRGQMSLREASVVIEQIAEAVDYLHKHGIIHRNIKPSNIMLDDMGNAYLADFEIALTSLPTAGDDRVLGTPTYMAPELSSPKGITPLVDVYALGVTFYEMLAGEPPYTAENMIMMILAHANSHIPDIRARRPDLPPAIQQVITRVLAKRPAERYRSAGAFAKDIEALVTAGKTPAPVGVRPSIPEIAAMQQPDLVEIRPVPQKPPPMPGYATPVSRPTPLSDDLPKSGLELPVPEVPPVLEAQPPRAPAVVSHTADTVNSAADATAITAEPAPADSASIEEQHPDFAPLMPPPDIATKPSTIPDAIFKAQMANNSDRMRKTILLLLAMAVIVLSIIALVIIAIMYVTGSIDSLLKTTAPLSGALMMSFL